MNFKMTPPRKVWHEQAGPNDYYTFADDGSEATDWDYRQWQLYVEAKQKWEKREAEKDHLLDLITELRLEQRL